MNRTHAHRITHWCSTTKLWIPNSQMLSAAPTHSNRRRRRRRGFGYGSEWNETNTTERVKTSMSLRPLRFEMGLHVLAAWSGNAVGIYTRSSAFIYFGCECLWIAIHYLQLVCLLPWTALRVYSSSNGRWPQAGQMRNEASCIRTPARRKETGRGAACVEQYI